MKTNEQLPITTQPIPVPIPSTMVLRNQKLTDPQISTIIDIKSRTGEIQTLNFSDEILEKFNVKGGDRVRTHKGWATVIGTCQNGILWFKLENEDYASHWGILTTEIIKSSFYEIEEYYLSSNAGLYKLT